MSSFLRRIQRQQSPSQRVHPVLDPETGEPTGKFYANPPRNKSHCGNSRLGRGQKLGVFNPLAENFLARLARQAKRKQPQGAIQGEKA